MTADCGEAARPGEGTPPYAKRHHKPQGGMAPCRRGVEDAAPLQPSNIIYKENCFLKLGALELVR